MSAEQRVKFTHKANAAEERREKRLAVQKRRQQKYPLDSVSGAKRKGWFGWIKEQVAL